MLTPTVGGWSQNPPLGTAFLTAPALVLAALVIFGTRSAIARALAVSLVVLCALFCAVAFVNSSTWELFHWRLSLVMFWIALSIGCAIVSPVLAAAWLRRGWVARLALYLPIAFAIIALIRNATGTDENLVANISPWPGVTVFGLEMGAYTIVGVVFGLAIGLGGLSWWSRRPAVALMGVLVGLLFPAIWFHQRFSNTQAGALIAIAVATGILLAFVGLTRSGERPTRLARRAAHFALGAALVITPVLAGRAWANADYTLNKFVRAKIVTDALATYYAKASVYPESLSELTAQHYLEELPRPRVGFDFLYDLGLLSPIAFSYRNLGSSYVLEFVSTEWVQCAYNPPWSTAAEGDEEYDDDEYEDEEYDDESGEAWSCPDTRPELWGNPAEGDGDDEEADA
jgi:hypothetical protein